MATTTTTTKLMREEQEEKKEDVLAQPLLSSSSSKRMKQHSTITTTTSSILPLLSILQHGRNRKASILEPQSWMALALSLDGRDKITKLLQYISRFLAWWLAAASPELANRFAGLKTNLTNSRKAFRLGRSFMELQKIRTSGLLEMIGSNLQQQGRSITYQLYRPVLKVLSTGNTKVPENTPFWNLFGSALKMIGLCGFWAGDNVNFLAMSGALDDYNSKQQQQRLKKRKKLQTEATIFANRSYFFGSVAGLYVSLRSYLEFRSSTIRKLELELQEAQDDEDVVSIGQKLTKAKEKQAVLFSALLKSCCDVLVFSNNPGIDLWMKHRGKKMHEGFHCVCGLLSASTVLYNNFPNQS